MQSDHKSVSQSSRRGSNIECNDPIRKNIVKTLTDDKLPLDQIYNVVIRAYAFVMQFANYESRGVMSHIFKIDIVHDGLAGSFDKEHAAIKYHVHNEEDTNSKTILKMALDESLITVPLAAIYDQYDVKLCFLATLFFQAYKNYKALSEKLEELKPSETPAFLPTLPQEMSDIMRLEIDKFIQYKKAYGKEFSTPRWEELNTKISTDTPHNFSQTFDDVARKFFDVPYFAGSQLHELLTVTCFIQETIVSVASLYLSESLFTKARMEFYQERWRKYVSIQCKPLGDANNRNICKLNTNIDEKNPRQMKDYAIVSKIVNFEKLNHYLSSEILNTVSIKNVYFTLIFDEMESFFVSQQRRIDAAIALKTSPTAAVIYANDFALEFMQHAVVDKAVKTWWNDSNNIQTFKQEFHLEAKTLMSYALLKSAGKIHDLVPAGFHTLLLDQNAETLEAVAQCFSKGYFDFAKIQAMHDSLPSLSAKLFFLLNVYTSAGMIILKLFAPAAVAESMRDLTNYNNARIAIAQIEKNAAEEKQPENTLAIAPSPQTNEASLTPKRIPFTGLNYVHQDFVKSNAAAILSKSLPSTLQVYKAIHSFYGFVLKFCDYESQGLMADIFDIKLPNLYGILATFDKNTSKLKWHPEKLNDYEDKIIIQSILVEEAITGPLSKVYDTYEKKMYHLSMLFHRTYQLYQGLQQKLQELEPLRIYPYLAKLDKQFGILNKLAGYMLKIDDGKYPSSKKWDETHARITSPVCTLVLPIRKEESYLDDKQANEEPDTVTRSFQKYIHQPYNFGSELDELQVAMSFIVETIFFVATKYLSSEELLKGSSLATFEPEWRKYNSVKCTRDHNGQLIINVDKNNFNDMRALAIIKKLVKFEILTHALSSTIIEKQTDKSVYLKTLFVEVAAFNAFKPMNLLRATSSNHYLMSEFLTEYLDSKIAQKQLALPLDTLTPEARQKLSADAGILMHYIDLLSENMMYDLTRFDLNFISRKYVHNLKDSEHQATISFNTSKLKSKLVSLTSPSDRFHFLTTASISMGLFILRLNSPSESLYDLTDYAALRLAIAKKGRPQPSLYASTNDFIGAQINNLLDQQLGRAASNPRTEKSKVKKTQPTEVKKDKPKQRSEKKSSTSNEKPTPPAAPAALVPPAPPALHVNHEWQAHKTDFNTTKSQYTQLKLKIESLQEELTGLTAQLQQTLALDNEERHHDLRPHKKRVKALSIEVYLEIEYLDKQIKNSFNDMKPEDEAKLEQNKTDLDTIKRKLTSLAANHDTLLAEIREASGALDHLIPKKTLKKAEEAYLEALRKKERLAREQEEEKNRPKKQIARPRLPKPSQRPITSLSLRALPSVAAKKTETKESKPNPKKQERLLHLNEACKNIILIQKMLTNYKTDLSAEVIHYALLYNIFRCFQSLKMYQQKGGQQRSINPDEVINLRNMIMHHGASSTHPEAVEAFAEEIKATLPQKLLKLTPRSVAGFELEQTVRHELMSEFNLLEESLRYSSLLDHSALVLDNTPFYLKLAAFHEHKTHNDDSMPICELVLKTYIPLIRNILPPLIKATSRDSEIKPEHFIEAFYFPLQALRMLVSICGEFEPHLKQYLSDKNLLAFLKFSRQEVRNEVAHKDVDCTEQGLFFDVLKRFIANIDEKSLLTKLKKNTRSYTAVGSSGLFSPSTAGSAMDVKYDTTPVQTFRKK